MALLPNLGRLTLHRESQTSTPAHDEEKFDGFTIDGVEYDTIFIEEDDDEPDNEWLRLFHAYEFFRGVHVEVRVNKPPHPNDLTDREKEEYKRGEDEPTFRPYGPRRMGYLLETLEYDGPELEAEYFKRKALDLLAEQQRAAANKHADYEQTPWLVDQGGIALIVHYMREENALVNGVWEGAEEYWEQVKETNPSYETATWILSHLDWTNMAALEQLSEKKWVKELAERGLYADKNAPSDEADGGTAAAVYALESVIDGIYETDYQHAEWQTEADFQKDPRTRILAKMAKFGVMSTLSGYLDCRERDFDALGSDEEDEDDEDAGDSRHDYEPGSACEKLHELVKHMQDAPKEIRSSLRWAEYWAKKPNRDEDDFLFD